MTTDGSLARYTLYPESCHAVDDHLMRGLYGSGFSPYVACGRAMCARCLEAGRVRACGLRSSLDPFTPFKRDRDRQISLRTQYYSTYPAYYLSLSSLVYARDVKLVNSTSCPRMRQNPAMPLAGVLLHRVQPCTCTSAYKVIEQLADWQVYDSITPAAQ